MPIRNPILPGFYPDPSICRAGDDFYMVTSTFSYFPGIPIFHSRDLAHWEQIGHVISRPSQAELSPDNISGGLFAPTIRYSGGKFYVIVQNVSVGGSKMGGDTFIFTATDPAGQWSDPVNVEQDCGDPSLFFDDDGRVYLTYSWLQMENRDVVDRGIYMRQIDPDTGEMLSRPEHLWSGALVDALSPEASHIYKKDGWYYLMIAEGGTEHNHCVAVARSRNVSGPYHGYEANPILTHRHLSYYYPICNVGHGDLVELKDGSWYMVMLASRLYGGYHKNLGRETFIAPVIWEHDWPAVSPGTGKVEWEYPSPALPETVYPQLPELDHFDSETLDMRWNFLGVPVNPVWEVRDSCLCLKTIAEPICPPEPPVGGPPFDGRAPLNVRALSLLGRRQQHMSFSASAALKFDVQDDDTAGICLLQNGFTQLRLEIALNDGRKAARVVKVTVQGEFMSQHYETEVLGCREITGDELELEVTAREQSHSFYITSGGKKLTVAEDIDGSFLGSESAGGFVGTYIALFASGNGRDTGREAKFDWFKYAPII